MCLYITQSLQWTEASELFNSMNRSSSHNIWCSRSWRKKRNSSHHNVSV